METYLQSRITDALLKVGVEQDNLPEIKIETPRVASHGDAATNVAMTLASVLRKNPRQIAQDIMDNLELDSQKMTTAEIAAPGARPRRGSHQCSASPRFCSEENPPTDCTGYY